MGYYTYFSLKFKGAMTKQKAEEIIARINEATGYEDLFSILSYETNLEDDDVRESWTTQADDETTWYDWEDDMLAIAKEYPEVEFALEGNGVDRGDWWYALFKGDKKQIEYCQPPIKEWKK